MVEYHKLPIALEYLEAAIEERELHCRYFSAMNLAGVAEEILGKIVRIEGLKDQLADVVDDLHDIQKAAFEHFGWDLRSKKDLKKLLNVTKNGIKHADSISDLSAKLFFEVEDESLWMIQAVIRNLDKLGIQHSGVVSQFVDTYGDEAEPNQAKIRN